MEFILPIHAEEMWEGFPKLAAKIDWLKKRPDMQSEVHQAILEKIEENLNQLPPEEKRIVDKTLPWYFRELKKGDLQPHMQSFEQNRLHSIPGHIWALRTIGKFLDEMQAKGKGIDIMQKGFFDLDDQAKKWAHEKEVADMASRDDAPVVHTYNNGWTIRQIEDYDHCEYESAAQGNCTHDDYGDRIVNGDTLFYSLRDEKNIPHATIQLNRDMAPVEVRGQANSNLKSEYEAMIEEWLKRPVSEGHWVPDESNAEARWEQLIEGLYGERIPGPSTYSEWHDATNDAEQYAEQTHEGVREALAFAYEHDLYDPWNDITGYISFDNPDARGVLVDASWSGQAYELGMDLAHGTHPFDGGIDDDFVAELDAIDDESRLQFLNGYGVTGIEDTDIQLDGPTSLEELEYLANEDWGSYLSLHHSAYNEILTLQSEYGIEFTFETERPDWPSIVLDASYGEQAQELVDAAYTFSGGRVEGLAAAYTELLNTRPGDFSPQFVAEMNSLLGLNPQPNPQTEIQPQQPLSKRTAPRPSLV